MSSSAFEEEPENKRIIHTDLERRACPSCGAHNVFLAHSVRHLDARRHVECRICEMRGPIKCSNAEAVDAWNALPRRKIKPLQWVDQDGQCSRAQVTLYGSDKEYETYYQVVGAYWWFHPSFVMPNCVGDWLGDMTPTKNAAQADYERRINELFEHG